MRDLKKLDREVVLLAMGEKTQESLKKIFEKNLIEDFRNSLKYGKIEVRFLEFLNQEEYEELIKVGMGGTALKALLDEIDLDVLIKEI